MSLHALRQLLPRPLGPSTHGKTFLTLRCYCDFEGHGRASETWEEHWEIELPQIPYHANWTNKGWTTREGETMPMRFHGPTHEDVLGKALNFLVWYSEDQNRRHDDAP